MIIVYLLMKYQKIQKKFVAFLLSRIVVVCLLNFLSIGRIPIVILPWRKVYGHLAIKLIYWQNTDKQDQSWYSIFSMWSLGLNDSGHAPWHGFVKGFDVLGGDLSPDPSGDFFGLFLKMTYQLQTSVISKRIELEQRDCAHMKDLLM